MHFRLGKTVFDLHASRQPPGQETPGSVQTTTCRPSPTRETRKHVSCFSLFTISTFCRRQNGQHQPQGPTYLRQLFARRARSESLRPSRRRGARGGRL
jgi:hypothetical protein